MVVNRRWLQIGKENNANINALIELIINIMFIMKIKRKNYIFNYKFQRFFLLV